MCDCDACLQKNKGKPKHVPQTTYFQHKPNRVARLFPPPLPAQTPAPILAPSSSKHPLDASDHPEQPPILKHKDDPIIAINGTEDDLDIPEAADNIPGPDALDGAFDHLEDTNFGDMGPEDREEEEEARVEEVQACVEDTNFGDMGPKDREEEEEAHVEDIIPENFDQDMPSDDVDPQDAHTDLGTMGWTDEDLDELQQMAHLEDAQDSMTFITALQKASLDDTHSKLPPDTLDRL
ncbi:hypothetical protein BDR06DRAFT_1042008 [Suillus hirtellus]|nr:hypothetical protein BDR06DRAFT_1042008 [Suillus hirtellus]